MRVVVVMMMPVAVVAVATRRGVGGGGRGHEEGGVGGEKRGDGEAKAWDRPCLSAALVPGRPCSGSWGALRVSTCGECVWRQGGGWVRSKWFRRLVHGGAKRGERPPSEKGCAATTWAPT